MASMISSAAQTAMVAPGIGYRAAGSFPVSRRASPNTTSARKTLKINCMKVWPPIGLKKFETLSYLPPLTTEQLTSEVNYLLRNGWVPCLEFELEKGFVYREHHHSPGYYDGRYWTMWKLPMFGCTDASQVLAEIQEVKKEYPNAFVRVIGFDNVRQVQCVSFIAAKPDGYV